MKKQILFLAAAIVAAASFAQTSHTVSNNPANPAQFTEIQEAINAASDGDTIYVAGSDINYGNVLVNKRVVLIGAGYESKGANTRVLISQLSVQSNTDDQGGSGSYIGGFRIEQGDLLGDSDNIISNVTIERNYFSEGAVTIGNAKDWIIRNCYFKETSTSQNDNLNFNGSSNLLFQNNLVQLRNSSSFNDSDFISGSSSAIIINNIFFDVEFYINDCSNFSNNIVYESQFEEAANNNLANNIFFSTTQPSEVTNTITGSIAADPAFENETDGFINIFSDDLNLSLASPGKNAGTDGTDIGVFGGNFPFVFEPANPEISQLLINTVQVPVGGELEFTIQAKGRQ